MGQIMMVVSMVPITMIMIYVYTMVVIASIDHHHGMRRVTAGDACAGSSSWRAHIEKLPGVPSPGVTHGCPQADAKTGRGGFGSDDPPHGGGANRRFPLWLKWLQKAPPTPQRGLYGGNVPMMEGV